MKELHNMIIILMAAACLSAGCRHFNQGLGYLEANPELVQSLFDRAKTEAAETLNEYFEGIKDEKEREEAAESLGREDDVPFGQLNWTYGGFNGSGAVRDPEITLVNGKFEANRVSFGYKDRGISGWGYDHTDASGALACYFVRLADGRWVGGKFDWISQSRQFRDLNHLHDYNGWTLDNVPNPTEAAFVIVGYKNGMRSNVIRGKWRR